MATGCPLEHAFLGVEPFFISGFLIKGFKVVLPLTGCGGYPAVIISKQTLEKQNGYV